jgi:hypothetical protein
MDKSDAGAGFHRELRFPLLIYIPSASPQSSSLSPVAGTIGQEWPHKQNKKIVKFIELMPNMSARFKLSPPSVELIISYLFR